jgi:hypothetical protein
MKVKSSEARKRLKESAALACNIIEGQQGELQFARQLLREAMLALEIARSPQQPLIKEIDAYLRGEFVLQFTHEGELASVITAAPEGGSRP